MSAPTKIRFGRLAEWGLLLLATAAILYLTIGIAPTDWQRKPSDVGYNLTPGQNVAFIYRQAMDHQLFTPKVAYEILALVGNIGVFWVWAFFALNAFSPQGKRSIEALVVAILVGIGLSLGIEALQVFLPDRAVDIDDVIANAAGAIVGTLHATFRRSVTFEWA